MQLISDLISLKPGVAMRHVLCFMLCCSCAHAFDTVRVSDSTKLFNVFDQSVSLVGAKYVGWGKNWDWAGVVLKPDKVKKADGSKATEIKYIGEIPKLNISLGNTIETKDDKMVWHYQWQKKTDHSDAMGVGIEFNLNINSSTFNGSQPDPELLPGKQGWSWQLADGQKVEVRFVPALANIFFVERNKKNKIRALIYNAIHTGIEETSMSVTVSGKKAKMAGPVSLSYDNASQWRDWPKDILAETVSPVDLSYLNHTPAGKHGFIKAKGNGLVFSDGTPARFWGGNIQAYAIFQSSDVDIKTHAKRIAQLGFNLMRITHHDSRWVNPNVFQDQKNNTQQLSEKSLKKLDWWIHCLKEEGVYVWLDLHVERTFTQNDDVTAFQEIAKGKPGVEVKGYNYYNESIQDQMQSFNKAYLNHVNSFTGLAYKDDPAILALLITNENDLTHHFGSLFLPDNKVPEHTAMFERDLKEFAGHTGLPKNSLWQVWGPGNAKLYLNDAEHRFNQKMLSHLRGMGVKSLIATTDTWANMSLYSLPSLTDGDLIDVHSYSGPEELSRNPRFNASYLSWIGSGQVTGKPLSVTEWNAGTFPVTDRFTLSLHIAAVAALQNWDAMMVYGYSQNKFAGANKVGNFSIYNDPAIAGLMPAAALLYRQKQVSPAKREYELRFSGESFYNKKLDPASSKTIRTLLETSRFSVTVPDNSVLPWLKNNHISGQEGASVITDPNKDMVPAGQNFVESDTGELKHDWEKGMHTVDSSTAQVVSGWVGGHAVNLSQVEFEIQTKKALVAVQSLDDKPLKQSKRILVSAMARCFPSDDQLHYMSEPVQGSISIKAQSKMKLYPINRLGQREQAINTPYSKGKYEIKLNDNSNVHWYLLTAE